jgi:hypothetical protein
MNNNYVGSSFFDDVKKWEKEDPTFRQSVDEYVEKEKLLNTGSTLNLI